MNLRCKVCGEKAAGFHFGAFTCEGCKSFFGRCCNNMSIIGECRNNKECVIDKKNRTSCKSCRLQKCLLVGMSKSGSRYGRRSNWFKQYFQENEHQTKLHKESDSDQRLKSVNTIEHLKPIDRISSLTSKTADTYRNTFTDIDPQKKISFDLCATQPLISSHLYLNYFPQLALNRFISYKQGVAESAFYVPNTIPFSTLLRSETNVNEYYEKLLVTRYDDGAALANNAANDDPLDLSQKRANHQKRKPDHHRSVEELDNDIAKKALPLDLSVK